MNYLTMMSNAYMNKTHNGFHVDSPQTQTNNSRNMLVGQNTNENNNKIPAEEADNLQKVWSKISFETNNARSGEGQDKQKMCWKTDLGHQFFGYSGIKTESPEVPIKQEQDKEIVVEALEKEETPKSPANVEEEETSPSHHARRPMNAFLIFCKKHRPIVREKYPNLENRSVTRILGEWWALLDENDKGPYTQLAKEYKDAFLSANPDFKWYKLPAPPLRTLNVRPTTSSVPKATLQHQTSPPHSVTTSDFTPGKLADESQLGGLTSLMNNNHFAKKIENNNNDVEEKAHIMQAAKPFKKRAFDNKSPSEENEDDANMTNQDLLNKVVDKIFTTDDYDTTTNSHRKSGRQCKGKRYEQFMVEGRLLGNKRDAKLTSQKCPDVEIADNFRMETTKECDTTGTPPNLNNTIKRLAERTNMKELLDNEEEEEEEEEEKEESSVPEKRNSQTDDFNLNGRISRLPSLSYEVFHQRKRESKKRKGRNRTDEPKGKTVKSTNRNSTAQLVGSKKRKNKQTITHLEQQKDEVGTVMNGDLLALATLAEVAANTERINDETK